MMERIIAAFRKKRCAVCGAPLSRFGTGTIKGEIIDKDGTIVAVESYCFTCGVKITMIKILAENGYYDNKL